MSGSSAKIFLGFAKFKKETLPWYKDGVEQFVKEWWEERNGFVGMYSDREYSSLTVQQRLEVYQHKKDWEAKNPLLLEEINYGYDENNENDFVCLAVPGSQKSCSDDDVVCIEPGLFDYFDANDCIKFCAFLTSLGIDYSEKTMQWHLVSVLY